MKQHLKTKRTYQMTLKVYILDDEPDICQVFKENFTTTNIDIQTFVDPQTLLETIRVSPPDLIFLDYRLPNTTGADVAKSIKILIPMALLTGDFEAPVVKNFEKRFNKQPFPWDEIEKYLRDHLEKKIA